ncbi:membrane or secreted protein [Novipirellula sp. SH528]|uniref:membrane or secreted protein n=1 Tax=Novipirellula sp. SH528 TaxID=3454466 RepID=UPI003FA08B17
MYSLAYASPSRIYSFLFLCVITFGFCGTTARAQDATENAADGAVANAGAGGAAGYVPAIKLLPDSLAGLVRVPNVPDFCKAWHKTHLGQLVDDPAMQPFIDAQRERAEKYFDSLDNRVGLKPQDLYDIASGEAVMAWLPFPKDKRRPFSVCVIADIRGLRKQADVAVDQIDRDLKSGGATRSDKEYRGQTIRVYTTKPKPGQLKIEQIAITYDDVRIIASDRDTVVTGVLDALSGETNVPSISESAEFRDVLTRSSRAMQVPFTKGNSTVAGEWFARPIQMGRILRETFQVDRGNQVDILKLLENQGFDAVKAAGGILAIAGDRYDVLHRGFVLAPPTTNEPSKYEKAARMLSFFNATLDPVPDWVGKDAGTVSQIRLKIADAFWASESMINEAFGDDIFSPMIEGIRDDTDGPQIDLKNNVLPALGDEVILMTDNTLPAEVNSERMLISVRLKNADAIKLAVRKAMEVEPDASKIDVLPGVEIWRVQRGSSSDATFEADIFGDLGFEEETVEQAPPLLDHWAIAVVDEKGAKGSSYLMFSSHPDLLIETVKRIHAGQKGGFSDLPEVANVVDALKDLGAKQVSLSRIARTSVSLRVKYELLRTGKLKDSDSILATIIRRVFKDENGNEAEPIKTDKLPPLATIEKHLPEGGNFIVTENDGWSLSGFYLK